MRPVAIALASAVVACAWSAAAARASCLEQVRELAKQQHVKTDPPTASPQEGGVTSKELRDSGGVIKPPPVADQSVISTPSKSADRMPTLPDVSQAPKGSSKDEATERTSLQSLLIAARSQAERGDEAQCLERLQKAHDLLRRSKTD